MCVFEKRWLRALDEFGKNDSFIMCQLKFKTETSKTGVWATVYVLICKMDYFSGRENRTHLTRGKTLKKRRPLCWLLKNTLELTKIIDI